MQMGGCQNYDPLLGPRNTRCRIILGTQKGAITLTITQMAFYFIRARPPFEPRLEGSVPVQKTGRQGLSCRQRFTEDGRAILRINTGLYVGVIPCSTIAAPENSLSTGSTSFGLSKIVHCSSYASFMKSVGGSQSSKCAVVLPDRAMRPDRHKIS